MGISRRNPRTGGRCIDEFRKVNVWLKISSLFLLALHAHVLNFKMMGKPNWWNRSVANKKRKLLNSKNNYGTQEHRSWTWWQTGISSPRGLPWNLMGFYGLFLGQCELRSTMRSTFHWCKIRGPWTDRRIRGCRPRARQIHLEPVWPGACSINLNSKRISDGPTWNVRERHGRSVTGSSLDLCSKWP